MTIKERVRWMPRQVRQFLTDFDTSLDYQEDAAPYCKRHPSDVWDETHLTSEGREARLYLLQNPEEITR